MQKKAKDVPKKYIKIFGLQRSGTNYLTYLLNENFKHVQVLVNLGGWKHGTYATRDILGTEIDLVILAKNPYAWLASVYDYWSPPKKFNVGPDLTNVSFEEFIKTPIYLEKQRGVPYMFRAANPIQHWNNMYYHYQSIITEEKKKCIVTYESLMVGISPVLIQLADAFDLEPVRWDLTFRDSKKVFGPAGEVVKPSDDQFDKYEYYAKKKYLDKYTGELVQYVNSQLDETVLSNMGYQLENK